MSWLLTFKVVTLMVAGFVYTNVSTIIVALALIVRLTPRLSRPLVTRVGVVMGSGIVRTNVSMIVVELASSMRLEPRLQ